jgi:hypothetical protein
VTLLLKNRYDSKRSGDSFLEKGKTFFAEKAAFSLFLKKRIF